MKKAVLLLAIGTVAAWWYFVGGGTITEDDVRALYRDSDIAMLERNPERLCRILADDFHLKSTVSFAGRRVEEEQDRSGACNGYREMFASFEELGEKMGGILQLDTDYELHSIEIASDKKSATVDSSYKLDVGGSIMNIRQRSTDVLINRNGRTLIQRSDAKGAVTGRWMR